MTEDGEGIQTYLYCYIKVAYKKVVCYQTEWMAPTNRN